MRDLKSKRNLLALLDISELNHNAILSTQILRPGQISKDDLDLNGQ